jgi:predicted dinucleotide-binding enzyme
MEIGVIGMNELAVAFCRHWLKKGHRILYSDLHSYSSGYQTAEQLGEGVSLVLPAKAAREAEVIVLAIAQKNLPALAETIGDVQQKIVIDLIADESEQAQGTTHKRSFDEIQALLPEAKVVKITSRYPAHLFDERKSANTFFTYGNDTLAQRLVHWFTDGLGYKMIDLQHT